MPNPCSSKTIFIIKGATWPKNIEQRNYISIIELFRARSFFTKLCRHAARFLWWINPTTNKKMFVKTLKQLKESEDVSEFLSTPPTLVRCLAIHRDTARVWKIGKERKTSANDCFNTSTARSICRVENWAATLSFGSVGKNLRRYLRSF